MKWIIGALTTTFASVFVMLVAPVIVLLADKEGFLPQYLAWAGQIDNSLDGDDGWRDANSHPVVVKLPRYVQRVLWLWRNPAQVLDFYLAARVLEGMPQHFHGDENVSDQPAFRPGYQYYTVGDYWMLFAVFPTFPGKCCRIYLGWKLRDFREQRMRFDMARLTCSINPFMKRGEK